MEAPAPPSHELVARRPHRALAGSVRSYYGFREETSSPRRRREGPDASVVVVVSFGHEWRIADASEANRPLERYTSFVAGLHDGCVITEHGGRSEGIQVNIEPTAAARLLGVPMHELARRIVPLDALFGPRAELLVERLADARSWDARFELLEDALTARLASAGAPSPGVVWAWRRLRDTGGRARVGSLAAELGWSRPRLVRRFREEVGLPPKVVARLFRIERAVELLDRRPAPSWAELAFACGYYDQSHMIHDFRELTGTTPTAFAAERAA
jgi:AraC-like DNA-binding protein